MKRSLLHPEEAPALPKIQGQERKVSGGVSMHWTGHFRLRCRQLRRMTAGSCNPGRWCNGDEKTAIQHDFISRLTKYLLSSLNHCDKSKRHKHSPDLALGKEKKKQIHAQSQIESNWHSPQAPSSMSERIFNLNFPKQASKSIPQKGVRKA